MITVLLRPLHLCPAQARLYSVDAIRQDLEVCFDAPVPAPLKAMQCLGNPLDEARIEPEAPFVRRGVGWHGRCGARRECAAPHAKTFLRNLRRRRVELR